MLFVVQIAMLYFPQPSSTNHEHYTKQTEERRTPETYVRPCAKFLKLSSDKNLGFNRELQLFSSNFNFNIN
jgi:hypothetical protein